MRTSWTALRFARDHDLLVAVRGGGHNVAGFGTCDGGLVIDLSALRGIRVDPAKRTVRAQAGVTWGDLDRETQAFGLAVPGGVVSTTGIAGLTLGGGQGWLRRTYGMTCDSLLSADVITSGGEFVTASDTERADLFWALRGGGGNFGIVTDFEYRLHPVGPVVTHAAAMYPVEAAAAVLPGFRDYVETAPDAVNASATFWTVPNMALFPERIHGRSVIAVNGVYVGDGQRGQQVLQALRTLGDPLLDVSEPRAYTSVQQMFDVFFPKDALRYYWKGLYLDSLGDAGYLAAGRCVRAQSVAAFHARRLGTGRRAHSRQARRYGGRVPHEPVPPRDPCELERAGAHRREYRVGTRRVRRHAPVLTRQTKLQFPGCRRRHEVVRECGIRGAV